MSSSSSPSSSSLPTGLRIPVYELAPAPFLQAVEHASSLLNSYSDDDGELFALGMAELVLFDQVPDGAVIYLPLSQPVEDQDKDVSFLASSPLAFLKLYSKPQPRAAYCQVTGYSDDTTVCPVALGAKLKFPSVSSYVVA